MRNLYKATAIVIMLGIAAAFIRCGDDGATTNPLGTSAQNQGVDSLTTLCEGACDIDSSSSTYT
jgi:hypothetical protein